MKQWILCASLLLPTVGLACDYERRRCEQQLLELLSYRAQAIQGAFGDLGLALPTQLQIKFVKSKDPEHRLLGGSIVYQPESKQLLLPRSVMNARLPNSLRHTAYYWPFYQNQALRQDFPVVEAIDDALWSVFLQEAARSSGNTWPHSNCNAIDIGKRLPCRMLLPAAARLVKVRGEMFFNENRIDRIWPDDIAALDERNFRQNDPDYADVLRFGGILLLRPLVAEFGVPRVLAYVARTPLLIEDDNLRISALRYQELARGVLGMRKPTVQMSMTGTGSQLQRAER
jgi:hypothetical protein